MRPKLAADHSRTSSAAVMEEYSYTSTHPLGHIGPVTGSLLTTNPAKNCIQYMNNYTVRLCTAAISLPSNMFCKSPALSLTVFSRSAIGFKKSDTLLDKIFERCCPQK